MTKKVRIENADASHYAAVVRVFDKTIDASGNPSQTLVEERVLTHPADLGEFYIHSTRYITISEN